MRRQTVSACLIVLNEEARLSDALASVRFCDEIIVVDGGSRDRTREIASDHDAQVFENPWRGFAAQRNAALDHARSTWILEIDADERVTPELRSSIESFLASPDSREYDLAAMPIRQIFLGRPLRSSARYPDYRHRLFRRDAYRHDVTRSVHEGISPDRPVWVLGGDLLHLLADSSREAVRSMLRYARLEATQMSARRTPLTITMGIVVRPLVKLVARLVVFGGWRDGWRGGLKIWLDCTYDALAWCFHLGSGSSDSMASRGHFGRVSQPRSSPRVVGLASRPNLAAAVAWLSDAAVAGADIALVAPPGPLPDEQVRLRLRALPRVTPLVALRSLDMEWQLRPYDSLVVFGGWPRIVARALPAKLRGAQGVVDAARIGPRALVDRVGERIHQAPEVA
jgi:hypothetical protein